MVAPTPVAVVGGLSAVVSNRRRLALSVWIGETGSYFMDKIFSCFCIDVSYSA